MSSNSVSQNGDRLQVPPGWTTESFVNPSGMIVLRAGSYAFPHDSGDDSGQVAQGAMGPNDVLINIIDFTVTDPANPQFVELTGSLTIDAAQATGQEGYTSPAAVLRPIRLNGRNLFVSVAFGSAPPSSAQVSVANRVLKTLSAS